MPDINFDCPGCSQNLDAPEEMAGQEIQCPACGGDMMIPPVAQPEAPAPAPVAAAPEPAPAPAEEDAPISEPSAISAAPAPEGSGTKCPECDADLAADAVLCVGCGYNLKTGQKMGGL